MSSGEKRVSASRPLYDRMVLAVGVPMVVGLLLTFAYAWAVARGPFAQHGATAAVMAAGATTTIVLAGVVELQRRLGAGTREYLLELERRSRHDQLTGLPTRDEVRSRLDAALKSAYRHDGNVGVLFLDLDGFKAVNDAMGHEAGDAVLREFAQRLRESVRADDVVGRFGGDEFVVICTDLEGPHQAEAVARNVLVRFEAPLTVADGEVTIMPSIGCAVANRGEPMTCDEMIARADQSMYRAKRAGTGVEFFDEGQKRHELDRMEIERALVPAIASGQFLVHYQPIVSEARGRAVGVEGLIRWHHPEHGVLAPDRFLSVAEEAGLGARLGDVVLREAVAQASLWNQLPDAPRFHVAVNLAERQLVDHTFPDRVAAILAWAGVPARQLDLEIGEELLLRRVDDAGRVLHRLAEMGCRIVVDDFGDSTGAFSRIRDLDLVDVVKIDRSVIEVVVQDDVGRAVVEAAVSMAGALGIELVAEGVETQAQRLVLRSLGVDLMQGYLFRRPMAADDFGDAGPIITLDDQSSGGSSNLSSRSSKLRALIDG